MNHLAAKIIENVCTTLSCHAQGFITGEVGPMLWYLFTHSTVDSLKITAVSVRNFLLWYRSVLRFILKSILNWNGKVLSMFSLCMCIYISDHINRDLQIFWNWKVHVLQSSAYEKSLSFIIFLYIFLCSWSWLMFEKFNLSKNQFLQNWNLFFVWCFTWKVFILFIADLLGRHVEIIMLLPITL